jgi:hypothetical protein
MNVRPASASWLGRFGPVRSTGQVSSSTPCVEPEKSARQFGWLGWVSPCALMKVVPAPAREARYGASAAPTTSPASSFSNTTTSLARFVPVVRTFAAVMAGAARMDFRRFALYSLLSGIARTTSVTLLGNWLGRVAVVRHHVELFVLGVVALSLVPVALEARRSRRAV